MLCPGPLLSYPKIPPWQVKVLGVPPGVNTMIPLTSGPKTSEHWVTSAPPPCPCSKGPPWQVKREGDPDDGASGRHCSVYTFSGPRIFASSSMSWNTSLRCTEQVRALFTEVRGRRILRTSGFRSSAKFSNIQNQG